MSWYLPEDRLSATRRMYLSESPWLFPQTEPFPKRETVASQVEPTVEIPTHIPLAVQERLFELECDGALAIAGDILTETACELFTLALDRLRSGYERFGSEMYTWDAETRRRNVLEELADAIVYLTSGPIE